MQFGFSLNFDGGFSHNAVCKKYTMKCFLIDKDIYIYIFIFLVCFCERNGQQIFSQRTETSYKNMGRKRSPSREVWIKASFRFRRDSGQPPEEERD